MAENLPPPLAPRSVKSLAPSLFQPQRRYADICNLSSNEHEWTFASLAKSILQTSASSNALWSDSSSSSDLDDVTNPDSDSNVFIIPEDNVINNSKALALLEKEYQSLATNPKAIMCEDGNIKGNVSKLAKDDESTVFEFWNEFLEKDSGAQIRKFNRLFIIKVRSFGIPSELRPKVWLAISNAKVEKIKKIYPELLKEESKFNDLIERDIPRTFPNNEILHDSEGGKNRVMFDILKAYSVYDSEVGYCQGLSFCVGTLLMLKLQPFEVFSIFERLMEDNPSINSSPGCLNYGLKSLFTPDMMGLHIAMYQHEELLKLLCPEISNHFEKHGVSSAIYASQWFLTLFSYTFPFPLVFRILDIMLMENALLTMIRFSVAILKRNKEMILSLESIECLISFLKGDALLDIYCGNIESTVRDVLEISNEISQHSLDNLSKNFYRLKDNNLEQEYKNEVKYLRKLVAQLENDKERISSQNLILENEVKKLGETNSQLRMNLVNSDSSRIKLLRDLHVLKSKLDSSIYLDF